LRILYFHQYFTVRGGIQSTRSYEFARRLVRHGHQVTVVTRDTRDLEPGRAPTRRGRVFTREKVDGIDVIYINVPYSNYMSMQARLLSFAGFMVGATLAGLALPRADIVFATSTPLTIGVPGLLTSRLKGSHFVFEVRDLWPEIPVAIGALTNPLLIRIAEWLEQTLYVAAEKIVIIAEPWRESFVARGIPEEKLVFIPHAGDTDLFGPQAVDDGFRRRHGLEAKFVAIFAGAMGVANGLDQLVDAAEALHHEGDERVHIVIIGEGSERPRLEERVRALALRNLTILPPVPKRELAGVVGACDATLTVLAPFDLFDTAAPNKFFDGLAAGKPVVSNIRGWLKELVETENVGIAVPPGSGVEIAAALAVLSQEPEMVGRMGRNARALAEGRFSRDTTAEQLAATFAEVAGTGGAASDV
jgi:glycosyltransferase involved in cell wall biosynthesis